MIEELTLGGLDDTEESSVGGGNFSFFRRRLAPISVRINYCSRSPYMQGKDKGPVALKNGKVPVERDAQQGEGTC